MNIEYLREYCLSKPGVTEDMAFGDDLLLFRLSGKIFACINLVRAGCVTLKCEPDYAVQLRDHYSCISGAWHWNKKHWNDVCWQEGNLPDSLVLSLVDHAYDEIRRRLPGKTLYHIPGLPAGWQHEHLPETHSTMDCVRSLPVPQSGHVRLVTADYQTAGRGQRGNHWEAAAGCNLLFSFSFVPVAVTAAGQFLLSEALSLAVAKALKKYCGRAVRIKWPNDIYCDDRKIAGLLLEHDLTGTSISRTIAGVGINVNQRTFVSDAPNPVSLFQLTGREVDRSAVLRNVLKYFVEETERIAQHREAALEAAYHRLLYRHSGLHTYRDAGGVFKARIDFVAPDGKLHLIDEQGGRRSYYFKEVEMVIRE